MAQCKNCGAELEDGVTVCPSCGTNTEESAAKNAAKNTASSDLSEKLRKLNDTKDTTEEFDAKDIEDNKVMGILAYLSWLVLIPLLAAKESKFARYHCNQGIVLAIAEIVTWVVLGLLSLIPYIGILFSILEWMINVVCLVLAILGIVNVVNGKAKELPFVGKFRIIKD